MKRFNGDFIIFFAKWKLSLFTCMIAEEVRNMPPFLGHYSTEFDVKAKDLLCEVSDHVFFFLHLTIKIYLVYLLYPAYLLSPSGHFFTNSKKFLAGFHEIRQSKKMGQT